MQMTRIRFNIVVALAIAGITLAGCSSSTSGPALVSIRGNMSDSDVLAVAEESLSNARTPASLDIAHNAVVSDHGISAVLSLASFESIKIHDCGSLTAETAKIILGGRHREVLWQLRMTNLPPDGKVSVDSSWLTTSHVVHSAVTYLDVSGASISDGDLDTIVKVFPNAEYIDLSHTSITEAGAQRLGALKNLATLTLAGCFNIGAEERNRLSKSLGANVMGAYAGH